LPQYFVGVYEDAGFIGHLDQIQHKSSSFALLVSLSLRVLFDPLIDVSRLKKRICAAGW
jgi:hypothetical protein